MRLLAVPVALLPLASAVSFPAPSPTTTTTTTTQDSVVPPPSSLVTPAPSLRHRQRALSRREEYYGDYEVNAIDQGDPAVCGYFGGYYTDGSTWCDPSWTCVMHQQDLTYRAMLGCSSGSSAYFNTACIDSSQAAATPSLTEKEEPFYRYCTYSDSPACATYIYSDIGITDFGCSDSSGIWSLYTTGLSYYATGTTVDRYDAFLTQVDNSVISAYEDSYSTANPSPSGSANTTTTSSSSSGSKPTGAIAGGVVGGVAGVSAIAAAGFFLLRKSRKGQQPDAHAGFDNHGGEYKAVPESASASTPPPAEMEDGDPAHRLAEVPGNAGAYEMDPTPTSTGGKNFIAELPADSYAVKNAGLPFCTANDAKVGEKMKLTDYMQLVSKTSNDSGKGDGGTGTTGVKNNSRLNVLVLYEKANASAIPQDAKDKDDLKSCNVYLVGRPSEVSLSDPVKKFLESKLDVDFTDMGPLPKAVLKQLQSSYDHKAWAAGADKGPRIHPAQMIEDHWGVVMLNNDMYRVCARKAAQNAQRFSILTENLENDKLLKLGQPYEIYNPAESSYVRATSNLLDYVPQFYFFAGKPPAKFAFWNAERATDEQTGSLVEGSVVSLVAWIPNSNKPGYVCLRKETDDFEILPGSPDLDKIARFKIKYHKATEERKTSKPASLPDPYDFTRPADTPVSKEVMDRAVRELDELFS
ncbi:hypothetical protein BDW62DRAFT_202450 [Aspergillus aurantiobrunneus]